MAVNFMLFSTFLQFFIVICHASQHENALNVPQVLLPYVTRSSKPTTFVLKAQKGCFHWSSTKPNVAVISPFDDKSNASILLDDEDPPCSQSALITVRLKTPDEDTTVVLAEEEGTGYTLRCDVFVDSIHKIEIATTTRELLLGESPEVFDVYAYDLEGNLFSSLGSQTFEWKFQPAPQNKKIDPKSVLRFLWFQDSSYETEAEIYELEDKHQRGYSALVEGINTGEAVVTARLSNPEYKSVSPSSVLLTVIDNVMLVPPVVYIMVHQTVKYDARQFRRGKKNDISLPSDQYSIQVVDDTIGTLFAHDASVRGKALGTTKVQLIDKNMADVTSARKNTATIHVVEPGKLGFTINPGKVWVLETNRVYEMHVVLFDDDNNRIEVTEHTIFKSVLSDEYFEIYKKSENGSYFHVLAKKVGKTALTAILDGIKYSDELFSTKRLDGEQKIEIFEPIVVNPDFVLFPWDPTLPTTQLYKYQLNATGGSGSYSWLSQNTTFASVSKKGVVMTGNAVGSGTIKVGDLKNPTHSALATVMVLPPHEMMFVALTVEVEVGKFLDLPLSVSAFVGPDRKEKKFFTDCRRMLLDVTFTESATFRVVSQNEQALPTESGCTSIRVEGLKVGHTTVYAVYTYGDVTLRASIVIAAYVAVVVVDPSEFTVVALGSSKTIIAEGGPLPWVLDSSRYYELMSAEEEEWVNISAAVGKKRDVLIHQNTHHFKVTCTQLGEQLLNVEVGNKPTAKNQRPASSSAVARFLCMPPASLKLVPDITLPLIDGTRRTLESCRDEQKRVPIRNNRLLRLNLEVYDSNGNIFDDVSSLEISWSTDDQTVASFVRMETSFEERLLKKDSNLNSGTQAYQSLSVQSKEAPVIIKAKITGYNNGIKEQLTPATTQLHMMMVAEPIITPNQVSLFAHSTNTFNLDVSHGTENFVLQTNDNSLASVKFLPPGIVAVEPQEEGRMIVYLYDACLDSEGPAEARLTLSDVYSLRLTVPDKVEIGQNIQARCEALDKYGLVLNVADVSKKLKLSLKISTDILEVKNAPSKESKGLSISESWHNLTGKTVGVTSAICQATSLMGNELSSKAEEVQIFSAIQLEPKYVLLIVGSIFQIDSFGGPRPQSTTSFSLDNETVAEVSQVGLVTALEVGKTNVTGKAKGVESITGKEIIYSQDQTIVEVIPLKGFKISLKTRNVVNNAELGVLAVGMTDESPFTFATSPPYLKFHWSSSNHEVAVVDSPHYQSGVSVTRENDFRAVLRTKTPGQVTIKLNVEVISNNYRQVIQHAHLEDTIQVQVFEKLELLNPASGSLLLPPHTHTRIQTNRDQTARVLYEVLTPCGASSSNVLRISKIGQISSLSTSGQANVRVVVHEEFGFNQTALVKIEVKPVASITLVSLSPFVNMEEARPSFPIGANAQFGVTLHDNTGRLFDVANIPLKHRVSRFDVIQVVPDNENSTFTLRGASIGETVFKVWDKENPSISDYIRVRIGEGIHPRKATFTLGGIECFTTPLQTATGHWSSSGKVLSIGQHSGLAVATSVGTTMVYYNDETFSTYTEVTVTAPSQQPYIISDDYLYVTNAKNKKKQFFISFAEKTNAKAHQCSSKVSYEGALISPFLCEVSWLNPSDDISVTDVFNVVSTYEKFKPVCEFQTKELSPSLEKQLSSLDRVISLTVKLVDQKSNVNWESSATRLQFLPTIHISESTLSLSNAQRSHMIDVFGTVTQLSGLQVTTDSSSVSVALKDENSQEIRYRYMISLEDIPTEDTVVHVKFYSPSTKITRSLPLEIRGEPAPPNTCPNIVKLKSSSWRDSFTSLLGDGGRWLVGYTVIIATVVLLIFFYHSFTKGRQNAPYVIQQSPYAHAHASPYVMQASPPPYPTHTHSPPSYHSPGYTPNTYGKANTTSTTPQRTLFSVSQ